MCKTIKELSFKFDDLDIDFGQVIRMLGYSGDEFPELFSGLMEELKQFAEKLDDIRSAYFITDNICLTKEKGSMSADEVIFEVGKTLVNELSGSTRIVFFVCTSGKTISIKSSEEINGDNPVLGYAFDILGSLIAEAAGDRLQQIIKKELDLEEEGMTNRYSPGHCEWSVEEQHKLFSFFPDNVCGVNLTESALMDPVKSISGIIGMGNDVKYRKCRCSICTMKSCTYRNNQKICYK